MIRDPGRFVRGSEMCGRWCRRHLGIEIDRFSFVLAMVLVASASMGQEPEIDTGEDAANEQGQALPASVDTPPESYSSMSFDELGPLPKNTSSHYVETYHSGITYVLDPDLNGKFAIMLKGKRRLPKNAYIEVHFPDPSNPANSVIVDGVLEGSNATKMFISPKFKGFKCWNYAVLVHVYRHRDKSELLETHRQLIQSRMNFENLSGVTDIFKAISTAKCP